MKAMHKPQSVQVIFARVLRDLHDDRTPARQNLAGRKVTVADHPLTTSEIGDMGILRQNGLYLRLHGGLEQFTGPFAATTP